jgi:hypothetical protein
LGETFIGLFQNEWLCHGVKNLKSELVTRAF